MGADWGQPTACVGFAMASLERRNGWFRITFRFGGRKFNRTLKTVSETEALGRLQRLEENARLVESGRLSIPPGADVACFLLSDGKLHERPRVASPVLLDELFGEYFQSLPTGSLEPTTINLIQIHRRHLARHFGTRFAVQKLSSADLQTYIGKRCKQRGRRGGSICATTVSKEIRTLRALWNWGVSTGRLAGGFPGKGLKLPKTVEKPPFQTLAEIVRRTEPGDPSGAAGLWDCVYLSKEEMDALLDHVQANALQPFVYPMFVMAAHTGARRSEIVRTLVEDYQQETILIRERKRLRGKLSTRRVPVSRRLQEALDAWLQVHPGGPQLFCQHDVLRSKTPRPGPTAITRDEAHDHFKRALQGSKWRVLPGWHCLRHSFISNCASKGIDQRMIDEWVGHTTEEMRRRYRHLFPSTQRDALNSVFG